MNTNLVLRTSAALVLHEPREIRALNRRVAFAQAVEDGDSAIRDTRITNGAKLGARAAGALTMLDTLITEQSHDNPGLELSLRAIQKAFAVGATEIIIDYMSH